MSQKALRALALNTATPGTGVSEGSAASDHARRWPWGLPAAAGAAWRVIARAVPARSAFQQSETKGSQERRRRGVLRIDGFDGGTRLEDRALPAPVINAAAGDFRESGQVTLTGTFGSVGPQVVLFDDFDRGTDAAPIRTGAGSATVGSWSAIQGQITYSSASTVSGSRAARADMSVAPTGNVTALVPVGTQDVFVSYWTLIPGGTRWPGEGNTNGINWKTVWVMGANTVDDDRTLPSHFSITGGRPSPTSIPSSPTTARTRPGPTGFTSGRTSGAASGSAPGCGSRAGRTIPGRSSWRN
jgi:hypothetical protein